MDSQNKPNSPITYCLYARKSSESDERQAMSIESQINEMKEIAVKDGVAIKDIRYESHSAKQSGERPVYKELIADIMLGQFNGIITWHPDRLSRNAGDLGMLVDLMDLGKLKAIKTYSQLFQNTPSDKFLLMILCSQAKLENDNKGVNVKRGIKMKCEMGWRPSGAPMGYMNRAFGGIKDIIIDPDRAPIIIEAFERVANLHQSGRTIKVWMDSKNFRTKTNKLITLSSVYAFLRNPFYYGFFEFPVGSGKWFKGSHKPLISKELFDKVQTQLYSPYRHSYLGRQFAFKGIFTCFNCGSGVCGEERHRKLNNGRTRKHIYYHCTRAKNRSCREPYIEERELIRQLLIVTRRISDEKLIINDKLRESMKEYEKILKEANYLSKYDFDGELKTREYMEYIIRDGTTGARQDLIECLPIPKKLHNKKLVWTSTLPPQ
jgi:site-specific DNA recombinase